MVKPVSLIQTFGIHNNYVTVYPSVKPNQHFSVEDAIWIVNNKFPGTGEINQFKWHQKMVFFPLPHVYCFDILKWCSRSCWDCTSDPTPPFLWIGYHLQLQPIYNGLHLDGIIFFCVWGNKETYLTMLNIMFSFSDMKFKIFTLCF